MRARKHRGGEREGREVVVVMLERGNKGVGGGMVE